MWFCAQRVINFVLAWSLSRMSRKALQLADLRRTIKVSGVRLASVTESAPTGAGFRFSDDLVFVEEDLGAA
jgi:hypothetical protein